MRCVESVKEVARCESPRGVTLGQKERSRPLRCGKQETDRRPASVNAEHPEMSRRERLLRVERGCSPVPLREPQKERLSEVREFREERYRRHESRMPSEHRRNFVREERLERKGTAVVVMLRQWISSVVRVEASEETAWSPKLET